MATAKKPTATVKKENLVAEKAETKTVKKTAEVKRAAEAVKQEVKEEVKEVKEVAAKAAAAVEEAVEKKAAPVKKAAEKKAPAKKAAKAVQTEVVLQWNGNDYTADRLTQSAKDVWQYDLGRDAKDINSIALYVKPEESTVYAVINGTEELKFSI